MRRGFAFSASIKNPPLLKSRNIQSQASITANVSVPLIGNTQQPIIAAPPQTAIEQTTIQMNESTSKSQQQQQQHHQTTMLPGPIFTAAAAAVAAAKQVQQKISNESIHDLTSASSQSQQTKNEHIV